VQYSHHQVFYVTPPYTFRRRDISVAPDNHATRRAIDSVLSLSLSHHLPFLLATTLKTFIPLLTSTHYHFASINLYETSNPWGKSGAQNAMESERSRPRWQKGEKGEER
jgi:hypothetical protein